MSRRNRPRPHGPYTALYRVSSVDVAQADPERRSIPIVLATETPVPVFDPRQRAVVNETLRMDGVEYPRQVPMVDTHERGSVRNVLGSIRDLRVQESQLVGRAFFSRSEDADKAFNDYLDGHLTDFSVGASVIELQYDEHGNRIVTRARVIEGSAVVAGQDPAAKALPAAMRAYIDPQAMREEAMNSQIKALLIQRGLPEDATDEEAVEFLDAQLTETSTANEEVTTVVTSNEAEATPSVTATVTVEAEPTEESEDMTTAAADQSAVVAERSRVSKIDEICRAHSVSDADRASYIAEGLSVEQASLKILNRTLPKAGEFQGQVEFVASEREKFYAAASAGMLARSASTMGLNPDRVLKYADEVEAGVHGPAQPYRDVDAVERSKVLKADLQRARTEGRAFQFASIPDIAREFLERSGQRVAGLPKTEIVKRAISQQDFVERSDTAYHTTGSFANLMLDAVNKTLLAGYDEAPHTYSMWVRTAPSAADFKALHRIRFGEMADPEVVPENHPYPEKSTSDARETYRVEKYGEIFSISMEAMVNDDLNAIVRIPQMQGAAMRRKINKVVYAILTSNPALSDGVTLFHATSHGANLDSNALAESALDTGFNVMATQTGLSGSGTPLGITPGYLIVPQALSATAYRLVTGGVVPTSAGANVPLYGAGRVRPLMVIAEAQLDGASASAWWLAADSAMVETVELTFLQGEESPVLSREDGFSVDSIKYKIRQTFGAAPIDYRGLYQGNS